MANSAYQALKNPLSEFIGTYILVLTIGCNALAGSATWGPLSIAAALMIMIYALASVSSAHFNPAVTFAVWLTGDPRWQGQAGVYKMLTYIFAQMCGAFAACFSYTLLFNGKTFNLGPGAGFGWGGVCAAEMVYTAMLCFVVLRVTVSVQEKQEYFGLAIGFVIVAGGYAIGHISGAILNPAAAISIDVFSRQGEGWCLYYALYQFLGAALATCCYRLFETSPSEVLAEDGRLFLAECIGTFYLVLTVGCNVLLGSNAAALSIAASLMCMIYALGSVSGGHFNPAVTLAATLAGKFPDPEKRQQAGRKFILYAGGQVFGAIIGAVFYRTLCGSGFPLQPPVAYLWGHAAMVELIYTFVLCFTVLNVAYLSPSENRKHVHGLAIGFCVVAGGFAAGPISGAALNPAVSIAVDTANALSGGTFLNAVAYAVMECLGGALAAGAFLSIRGDTSATKQQAA